MTVSTQAELSEATGAADPTITMSYRDAIRAAMSDAMAADPRVLLMGEDVGAAGGPFKTSEGLLERFGPSRVFNTPICENGFVGVALGLATTGLRPIVEIMFGDFLLTAADAIVNEVAKARIMSGGRIAVPITIRSIGGASGSFGAQHSATGESWFLHASGLRIVTASSPGSAYTLLRESIQDDNPVLFIEHKGLYSRKGPVQRGTQNVPQPRKAEIVRRGTDITIVATLLMVERALTAAAALADEGIEAEVIDLRWLSPLDYPTVAASVARTGRLLVAEEQGHAGGWGATLISQLTMDGTVWRTPPRAASMPHTSIPVSPTLEELVVPSGSRIAETARVILGAA